MKVILDEGDACRGAEFVTGNGERYLVAQAGATREEYALVNLSHATIAWRGPNRANLTEALNALVAVPAWLHAARTEEHKRQAALSDD
jgi:sorbitol-specific phosphotransferase system component IIA